ncbi:AraC family transcriptional regulator [Kribbella sp. NPDC051770]|uniref:AraC family transcriptional regulator n=1 Tax=Kribbella sp. NPDC051770 TaxID=3155413 RepID=UPI003442DC46
MPETLHEATLFQGGPVWGSVHHLTTGVDPHAHDFLELAVIGPGAGRHQTSSGSYAVQHGQVLILRPGAWHAFTACDNLTVANCCVSTRSLRTELNALQQLPAFRDLLWPTTAHHGTATLQVTPTAADDAIALITHLATPTTPALTLARLTVVLATLADGRPTHPVTPPIHPAVTTTITHFESALAHPWTLDSLAHLTNLNPAYLSRLFKHHTGLSPLAHLARLRAEQAALLLTDSTLPTSRVGAAVGWPDPTYFARRFRTLVGLTPTEYRAQTQSPPAQES